MGACEDQPRDAERGRPRRPAKRRPSTPSPSRQRVGGAYKRLGFTCPRCAPACYGQGVVRNPRTPDQIVLSSHPWPANFGALTITIPIVIPAAWAAPRGHLNMSARNHREKTKRPENPCADGMRVAILGVGGLGRTLASELRADRRVTSLLLTDQFGERARV